LNCTRLAGTTDRTNQLRYRGGVYLFVGFGDAQDEPGLYWRVTEHIIGENHMHSFSFAESWADIMTGQLTASRGYRDPAFWGYACLCVGNRFEAVLDQSYEDIDFFTGEYLHVFSFFPPPLQLVDARIAAMMGTNDSAIAASLTYLQGLRTKLTSEDPGGKMRGDLRRERILMLQALKDADVRVHPNTDFIFFDFRSLTTSATRHGDIDIDVVAAMQSPMRGGTEVSKYVEFFQGMANIAEDSF
jgi:hypothetical protein